MRGPSGLSLNFFVVGSFRVITDCVDTAEGRCRASKRCHSSLERESVCVQVTIRGPLGHKTFCRTCFGLILDATQRKVDALRAELRKPEAGIQI